MLSNLHILSKKSSRTICWWWSLWLSEIKRFLIWGPESISLLYPYTSHLSLSLSPHPVHMHSITRHHCNKMSLVTPIRPEQILLGDFYSRSNLHKAGPFSHRSQTCPFSLKLTHSWSFPKPDQNTLYIGEHLRSGCPGRRCWDAEHAGCLWRMPFRLQHRKGREQKSGAERYSVVLQGQWQILPTLLEAKELELTLQHCPSWAQILDTSLRHSQGRAWFAILLGVVFFSS